MDEELFSQLTVEIDGSELKSKTYFNPAKDGKEAPICNEYDLYSERAVELFRKTLNPNRRASNLESTRPPQGKFTTQDLGQVCKAGRQDQAVHYRTLYQYQFVVARRSLVMSWLVLFPQQGLLYALRRIYLPQCKVMACIQSLWTLAWLLAKVTSPLEPSKLLANLFPSLWWFQLILRALLTPQVVHTPLLLPNLAPPAIAPTTSIKLQLLLKLSELRSSLESATIGPLL